MTFRFVLEESSWANAYNSDALTNAIDQFLERLDLARERNEHVVRQEGFYSVNLGGGVELHSALFESTTCPLQLDHDRGQRLRLMLDRTGTFSDEELEHYDVEFDGKNQFAPEVAWAHAECHKNRNVAVLPLPLGDVPQGNVPVSVAGVECELHFVTRECHHVGFFRSAIQLENANEQEFERLARSAFPALKWADSVWSGLGDFSRPYIEVRNELILCLGGLNDHGANCFHERHLDGDLSKLPSVLSARVGFKTSDENGRTKRFPPARRDRTRRHRGTDRVFWWHAKLKPNVDRVYFLYESPVARSAPNDHGRIVVGLFKHHCILPN